MANTNMSSLYTRLHRIFSSTQKPANIFNSSTQKATKAIKSVAESPNPTKEQTRIKARGFTLPKNRSIIEAVRDLSNEKDCDKLLQKFTSLSESGVFRRRHYKVYDFTVHRFALAKRFSLIEQALEPQKKFICGEGFAARLIYLYGKSGMFDHAYKVFDEMPKRKCERGTKSFNSLLSAAVNSKKFEKVYELFKELPSTLSIKPDVDSYNRVLNALCELGSLDDAVSLLDEIEANGLKPNVVSYNTLMCDFYKRGEILKAEETWDRMIKSGFVPDIDSYNFKMLGLVNEGKFTEAIKLLEELKSSNIKPDLGTYNALIKGSCESHDLEGAKMWYDELLKHGCVPNKVTFSTLIPFLCENGDYGFAFNVCQKKFKRQCSVIDEASLQNVVDGLVKNSMMEEAEILVKLASSSSYVAYSLSMP